MYNECSKEPRQGGAAMGILLNPGNIDFSRAVNSEIYIDKSELINYTNNVIDTEQRLSVSAVPVMSLS